VLKPAHDPNCLMLWGVRQERETSAPVLLAAAVAARLPHPAAPGRGTAPALDDAPSAPPELTKGAPAPQEPADHDGLLRRLRELGDLHRGGVLTDEEFAAAKKAVLARF
jgi:hypothetical protein